MSSVVYKISRLKTGLSSSARKVSARAPEDGYAFAPAADDPDVTLWFLSLFEIRASRMMSTRLISIESTQRILTGIPQAREDAAAGSGLPPVNTVC